eukprot:TRINITY_DN2367_c0_g1_i5.p6 TRINITY_DN2367_c0_g1~~TRINITY_DN2367_c0_g1_i5.p6  ORF type:complete len:119 (+),score=20.16 TRINITY_DN2367_c0_g1_i5:298-654(+)
MCSLLFTIIFAAALHVDGQIQELDLSRDLDEKNMREPASEGMQRTIVDLPPVAVEQPPTVEQFNTVPEQSTVEQFNTVPEQADSPILDDEQSTSQKNTLIQIKFITCILMLGVFIFFS